MAAVEDFLQNGDVSCKFTVTRMENENIEQLNEEIHNLEKLIRLTKERLERLNAQFGKQRHPPALYLQEYEELANKIHELQTQLQDKEQALTDIELEPPEPKPKPEPTRPLYPTTPINLAPCTIGNGAKIEHGGDMGALPSPSLSMKSPVGHVKAFLPNNQRTSVTVKVGKTLGEGLAKAMKLRDFDTEDCDVYDRSGRQLSWDDPMTDVAGYELTVDLKKNRRQHLNFPGVPNHNIVC